MMKPKPVQKEHPRAAETELLTLEELAARLKMHPGTVRRWYWDGKIPGLKLGYRTLRFSFVAVVEALEARQATQ